MSWWRRFWDDARIDLPESERQPRPAPDPTAGFSNDEVDSAALDYVFHRRFFYTEQDCNEEWENLRRLRRKYENFEPTRMRRAIMRWLDWYDRSLDERREEVAKRDRRKRLRALLEPKP